MEDMSSKNCVILGIDASKLSIFKVLDSFCDSDGLSSSKDVVDKPSGKSKFSDSLEYLKTQYKIKIDAPMLTTDNGKTTKKNLKRKLFPVKIKHKNKSIQYLTPLLNHRHEKSVNDFSSWFNNKMISTNFLSPEKNPCKEVKIDSSVIYAGSTFYRSRSLFTYDRNQITFQICLKEWFVIELPANHLRSITVYSKCPIIKMTVKNKVGDEISKLSMKYGVLEGDTYRNTPKKSADVKDTIIFFTNKVLSKPIYERLGLLFGFEKMRWNDTDMDGRDLIENVLCKIPNISEVMPPNSIPNWPLIFKIKTAEPQVSKVMLPVAVSQSVAPLQNPVIRHQQPPQTNNVLNLLVNCSATSTPKKFDTLPNLFNRLGNDPTQMLSNGPYQLSNISPNISQLTISQYISNGVRPAIQPLINVPILVNVDRNLAAVNTTPKPVQNNILTYVPNRNLDNVFETFHYNPTPDSDVLIHGSDLLCLNQGQYLNDNIINFYLNYIRYEIMTEDQRQRTHLFNVFFNTKLQGNPASIATEPPEIRHARVAKWTKKVDIFDKDFIIIPINENQHWFLAIVCFPWMAGMISYDQLLGVNNNQQVSEIPVNKTSFATKYRYERVQRLRDQYGVEPSPCILLFDSLQYQSRAPNVKLIRDYLKSEWDSKRLQSDGPLVFDKNTVRGFNPQVPQQDNNIDCGIFVLHYVEQFFSNPLKLFTKEYFQSSLTKWFSAETVAIKRSAIQNMVLAKADSGQRGLGGGGAGGVSETNNNHNTRCVGDIVTEDGVAVGQDGLSVGLDDSGPDLQMIL